MADDPALQYLVAWKRELDEKLTERIEAKVLESKRNLIEVGFDNRDRIDALFKRVDEMKTAYVAMNETVAAAKLWVAEKDAAIEKNFQERSAAMELRYMELNRYLADRMTKLETRIQNFIFVVVTFINLPIVVYAVTLFIRFLKKK
jgi:hypothetical protein